MSMVKDAVLEEIRANLRAALNEKGKTHRALAADLDLSDSVVSVWLTQDKGLRQWARLRQVAKALGVSADRLLGLPVGPPHSVGPGEAQGREWAYLPKVATAAAGEPIDFEHDEVDWYAFHQSWVEQMAGAGAVHDAQRVILVDVSGESMLPTIRDGALCVVDRGPHGGASRRRMISSAWEERGTTWTRPAFIRAAGTTQRARASSSTSSS